MRRRGPDVSAHRRPEIRFSDAPRGECRWCGETILYAQGPKEGEVDRRRRWHPECVDVYNASDPREARRLVRKRDRGVCAECRLDTNKLRREVQGRGRTKKLRERGFVPRRSLWELDHIVPLIDGGGHELPNLQTLCTPCHKKKTAREATLRAARGEADRAAESKTEARATGAAASTSADRDVDAPGEDENPASVKTEAPKRRGRSRRKAAVGPDLDALLARAGEVNARAEIALQQIAAERSRG
jgi:5-methylcytosine-specific restriction endonuclease McrA